MGAFYVVFLLWTAGFSGVCEGSFLFFFKKIPYLRDLWGSGLGSGFWILGSGSSVKGRGDWIQDPDPMTLNPEP